MLNAIPLASTRKMPIREASWLLVQRRNFIFLPTSMSFDHSVFSDIHYLYTFHISSPRQATEEQKPYITSLLSTTIFTGRLRLKQKLQYLGQLIRRADSLEKTLILGKTEGKRIGQQRMRRLDSITDSTDMNLSKCRETVRDRGAWCCAVHWVAKRWTWFSHHQQPQSTTTMTSTSTTNNSCD